MQEEHCKDIEPQEPETSDRLSEQATRFHCKMQEEQNHLRKEVDSEVSAAVVPPHRTGLQVTVRDEKAEEQLIALLVVWASTSLLSTGVLDAAIASWLLVTRAMDSILAGPEVAMWTPPLLSLAGGLSAFVCSCLLCAAYDNPPGHTAIWYRVIFTSLASLMLSITSVGFAVKYRMEINQESNMTHQYMQNSLSCYEEGICGRSWDGVQTRLQCCGVAGADDWMSEREEVPDTCCEKFSRSLYNLSTCVQFYQSGCMEAVVLDMAYAASLLAGMGFILIIVLVGALSLALVLWTRDIKRSTL